MPVNAKSNANIMAAIKFQLIQTIPSGPNKRALIGQLSKQLAKLPLLHGAITALFDAANRLEADEKFPSWINAKPKTLYPELIKLPFFKKLMTHCVACIERGEPQLDLSIGLAEAFPNQDTEALDKELYEALDADYERRHAVIDKRVILSEARQIRRLDSLSTLLTLRNSYSVCTAVTVIDDSLYVSSNVNSDELSEFVIECLEAKILAIRSFLQRAALLFSSFAGESIETQYQKLIVEQGYQSLREALIGTLKDSEKGGNSVSSERLRQCCDKLMKSTVKGKSFGLAPEDPYIVMAPAKDVELGYTLLKKDSWGRITQASLDVDAPVQSVRYLHAEQMLCYYLIDIVQLPQPTPLQLGISKLSCHTCHQALITYRVAHRGSHQKAFPDVYSVATDRVEPITRAGRERVLTIADNSPEDSAGAFFTPISPTSGYRPLLFRARTDPLSSASPSMVSTDSPVTDGDYSYSDSGSGRDSHVELVLHGDSALRQRRQS